MKPRSLTLQQAIYELEPPIAADDLIVTYADFLQHRDLLHYYQFNPNTFEALIRLTHSLWQGNKRICRLSLVQTARRYFIRYKKPIQYSPESRERLFDLFRWIVIDQTTKGNKKAIEAMEYAINSMLRKQLLNDDQVLCLCANINKSPHVVNRMLRYPGKSRIITSWVKDNFSNDSFRNRRAEMTSWLLNEDPNYIIPKQVLIDDFEYLNQLDRKLLADYADERDAEFIVRRDLGGKVDGIDPLIYTNTFKLKVVDSQVPDPVFNRRFYPAFLSYGADHPFSIPDFTRTIDDFYRNLDKAVSVTMMWATYYGHYTVKQKEAMLIKHFEPTAYGTFFRLAKQLKSVKLLRWLERNTFEQL
ncbi:MAG: hypothetical protein V4717_14895 [Bacteroidota bacterium]